MSGQDRDRAQVKISGKNRERIPGLTGRVHGIRTKIITALTKEIARKQGKIVKKQEKIARKTGRILLMINMMITGMTIDMAIMVVAVTTGALSS